jgi:hypothetical protein
MHECPKISRKKCIVPYKIHVYLLYFEAHNLANTTSKKNAALQVYNSLLAELMIS